LKVKTHEKINFSKNGLELTKEFKCYGYKNYSSNFSSRMVCANTLSATVDDSGSELHGTVSSFTSSPEKFSRSIVFDGYKNRTN